MINLLIARGANVNAKTCDGVTPLMFAHASIGMTRILLKQPVNINDCDQDGWSALRYNLNGYSNTEVIKMLLDSGINVNATNNYGQTALHLVLTQGMDNINIINLLLEYGADPSIKCQQGRKAVEMTDNEEIKTLLNEYRPVDIKEPEYS
jgi:ankyrin repeat protein